MPGTTNRNDVTNIITTTKTATDVVWGQSIDGTSVLALLANGTFVRKGNSVETVTTAAPALAVYGVSLIDSSSNAVDATLADGTADDPIKIIVMTEASNSSTVVVASHEDGDDTSLTFDALKERAVLIWVNDQWCSFTTTAT